MTKLDIDAIRKLSVAERLGLIDQIWESLSDDPDAVPISEEHLAAATAGSLLTKPIRRAPSRGNRLRRSSALGDVA